MGSPAATAPERCATCTAVTANLRTAAAAISFNERWVSEGWASSTSWSTCSPVSDDGRARPTKLTIAPAPLPASASAAVSRSTLRESGSNRAVNANLPSGNRSKELDHVTIPHNMAVADENAVYACAHPNIPKPLVRTHRLKSLAQLADAARRRQIQLEIAAEHIDQSPAKGNPHCCSRAHCQCRA